MPLTVWCNEADCRGVGVVIIGMGHIANRLVKNEGEALRLLHLSAPGERHHLMRKSPGAELGHWLAIQQHQALFNILIGLPA